MKFDYSKLKLVIWDLDDTFWEGTISEGNIKLVDKNLSLVHRLTDHGIINSICSKNTFSECEMKLKDSGIWDYFVFNSIDWTPKGLRINNIISSMGLRAVNVLFIDDNPVNLNEALHYNQDLMIGMPDIINELEEYLENCESKQKDIAHKRLNQYKILEAKFLEKNKFDNNEEFLYSSNIKVDIQYDCLPEIDRITELVERSNQLNYTKCRDSKEDILKLINDTNYKCGYVLVYDKYGDYGLVGFFVIGKNENFEYYLKHFLFSCRSIGQGIEQYVYSILGYPKLNIVGNVVSEVNNGPVPMWINNTQVAICETDTNQLINKSFRILLKGPCDLLSVTNYIKSEVLEGEFTYIAANNNVIESHNQSTMIVAANEYSKTEKELLINECIFLDHDFFKTNIYLKSYNIIFLSSLMEPNIGMYKKKGTNLIVSFGEYSHPLTIKSNWNGYIDSTIYNGQNKFTLEILEQFTNNYDFIGRSEPEEYIKHLEYILSHIDKYCKICIILGSELSYHNNKEKAYIGRELEHRRYNEFLRKFATQNNRILLLDINDFIMTQSDYSNNINHYSTRIYYQMAQRIIDLINSEGAGRYATRHSKLRIIKDNINYVSQDLVKKIIPRKSPLFKLFQKIYRKIKI